MKKREKFLIAFLISFVIIMSRYIYIKTYEAIYEAQKGKQVYEWLFINQDAYELFSYDNITDEAKQYFEEEIQNNKEYEEQWEIYCSEHPEECAEIADYEREIGGLALDYIASNTPDIWRYFDIATAYDITIFRIFLLTLIIYEAMTIEFKNKKQYLIDNVKLILVIAIFSIIGIGLIWFHQFILDYSYYYIGDLVDEISTTLSSILTVVPIIYISIFIPNVIINIIKNKKKKRVSAKSTQQ